ncbi:unnamed protein product [Paramecium octaurelia]|uniref:Uncharacterized protein n=1 Tax=Paramecium octaurelia TaxID=43137 RepID=A0A8S1U5I0_PAROT|nr:unnamed protein product [Paramecium octaurelia]CAD8160731.1 unnamed protein product [Paramecium octaurelia]
MISQGGAEYQCLNKNALQHEIKQLKIQCAELKQLLLEQIETNLTKQYSKALKELQENLTLATSNCQIYRNSMNFLAQEKTTQEQQIKSFQNEIQQLKKQRDVEKNELQMIIARGNHNCLTWQRHIQSDYIKFNSQISRNTKRNQRIRLRIQMKKVRIEEEDFIL